MTAVFPDPPPLNKVDTFTGFMWQARQCGESDNLACGKMALISVIGRIEVNT